MKSHPVRTTLLLLGLVFVMTLMVHVTEVYASPSLPPDAEKAVLPALPGVPMTPTAPMGNVFTVVYKVEGEKDAALRDCHNWPAAAQADFNQAVDLWTTLIYTPPIPIEIHACWTDLPSATYPYGYDAQPANWIIQYGAPEPGLTSYYPSALANTRFGDDLTPTAPEITISCNRGTPWHFSASGALPSNEYDFLTAALRQIAFGLGFRGFMKVENTVDGPRGYWVFFEEMYPALYDRFVVNAEPRTLISFSNGSDTLAAQLQSGNLFFDGYGARISNGGTPPRLFSPSAWIVNSSYIHLDPLYNGTENGLMTPPAVGVAYHDPGPVTLGILRDLGWDITRNTPPLLLGLPDVKMAMNSTLNPVIDLWPYASDVEEADDAKLIFSVDSSTPYNPGVVIHNEHYISITLASGWHGSAPITIRVTDPKGAHDLDTFIVTTTNSAPTLSGLPDIIAPTNKNYTEVLDLRRYANDFEDARRYLTFLITNVPDSGANITLSGDGGRFLNIYPQGGYLGKTSVTIQVKDRGDMTGSDAFSVTVVSSNVTPTINITDQWLRWNTTRDIDLLDWDWDVDTNYARDPEGLAVTLSIANLPDPNAGVSIVGNRFVHLAPATDWLGSTIVTVRVQDFEGLVATDSFKLVVWRPEPIYMPLIFKGYGGPEG
ncbi:MAG: hypothetical protein JXA21_24915 [Anaerolineae bacterium]|nr:hypothetical protein [Anaerolineae bacterium]